MKHTRITADLLLQAYTAGIFPMAERRESRSLLWISPDQRGIIPLDRFHVPKRLARTVKSDRFEVRIDTAFSEIMMACAAPAPGREQSWINDDILSLYGELHTRGHAHSVESWRNGQLVGGLYGVQLGAAFFGESMFSRERDASKVALVHLVARLIYGGFRLLDAQFLTDHLAQFGAIAIPRNKYLDQLQQAVEGHANLYCPAPSGRSGSFSFALLSGETGLTGAVDATVGACWPGWLVLQLITQTS
ncbi:MAG: leucyl/phenylalanyl-tRNA--protein transferase [Alphaproteobacteria bacterium]|nr:leucyl/phenylalanyl-tRNA--protein transferase [Alphaproteobacteria bacterium]MBV9063805.1 leucyl/phenylalanyl-tRNA--protein transferase [Alphaproteobacteria bacterium]